MTAPKRQAAGTASLISEITEAIAVPPATIPALQIAPPLQPALVRAIAPERYKLQVTISAETRTKLRRAQDLLRHTNRSVDEAAIIDRALTVLVEQLEKVKYGRTERPRPAGPSDSASRYVPAHVRRAVSERDGYRCAFLGTEGRCTETAGLQYHHHPIPFADGGPTTVDNLELRCPAHNAYEAERWFGPLFVRETGGAWPAHRAWSGPSPLRVGADDPVERERSCGRARVSGWLGRYGRLKATGLVIVFDDCLVHSEQVVLARRDIRAVISDV